MTQISFDLEPDAANPNAHWFDSDGQPRRLLWCSDSARMGGPCPYLGKRVRFRPAGGCCKDLVGKPQTEIDRLVQAERAARRPGY